MVAYNAGYILGFYGLQLNNSTRVTLVMEDNMQRGFQDGLIDKERNTPQFNLLAELTNLTFS